MGAEKLETKHTIFTWDKLGDIAKGRPNLGPELPVAVYRLFAYSNYTVLTKMYGSSQADKIIQATGFYAGQEFAKNLLDSSLDPHAYLASLAEKLLQLKVGLVRLEHFDEKTGHFTLTVDEDLDCSGLPNTNEYVCKYDEGFLAGIAQTYTGKKYSVQEVDCWCSGSKTCRFKGEPVAE